MFQKIGLTLTLSALLLSANAWAQASSDDMDQIAYCYGVYSATKNKNEVAESNRFLAGAGNAQSKITGSPSFRQGFNDGPTLAKKQKSSCYLIVYGFLGAGYSMTGRTDTINTPDLAYCMGYVNEARTISDPEMIQEFCYTEKNLTAQEKKKCVSELTQIIKQNTRYQNGRKEAQKGIINPIRVMNCGMKLSAASEKELDKAMGTHQNSQQPTPKATPKKPKDTLTTPIFR